MKFTIRTVATLSALTAACATFPTHAQTTPDVPKNPCVRPSDYVPIEGTSAEMARVTKRVEAYKTCINDYAKGVNGKAVDLAAQAQAYQSAGNGAIDEFNAFVADMNAKTKGGDASSPDRPKIPPPSTSAPSTNKY